MKKLILILIILVCVSSYGQDSILRFHQLASLPEPVPHSDFSAFVIDSDLYIIGGQDSAGYYTDAVWKYHAPADSWTKMSDFPGGAIAIAGSFAVNGKGYISGGTAQNTSLYYSVWEYTPASDTWVKKNDYPGRSLQTNNCFTYAGKGYLGFGYPGSCNDLWEYDQLNDQWQTFDTLPAPGRYGCTPVISDSFAYFFGGYYRYIYGHSCHETWRFNLIHHHWEEMSQIPGTDRGHGVVWNTGNFIIYGLGVNYDSIIEYQTDRYIYDTRHDSWKPIRFQGFLDSITTGYSFMIGNTGYYYGGIDRLYPEWHYSSKLFSFDATPLLTTAISETKPYLDIKLYPNPLSESNTLNISTPEEGTITFTNNLGQILYTTSLHPGDNIISTEQLHEAGGIIFYAAQLRHGTANGKIVIVK